MNRRRQVSSDPTALKPGDVELEMGVPIPGVIVPRDGWTQTALKQLPSEGILKFEDLFQRSAPMAIDIGCGNGRFTISSAVRRPDWDHLGIDILPAVIRYATRRGNQRALKNVRFAVCDGWRLLSDLIPDASVDEFHIYHPQPYFSADDFSKRMLHPQFLVLLHQRLKATGKIFLQTDRKAYWQYIQKSFRSLFEWTEQTEPWSEDPWGRSRREMLSQQQGLAIFRGVASKRNSLTNEEACSIAASMAPPAFAVQGRRRRRK